MFVFSSRTARGTYNFTVKKIDKMEHDDLSVLLFIKTASSGEVPGDIVKVSELLSRERFTL